MILKNLLEYISVHRLDSMEPQHRITLDSPVLVAVRGRVDQAWACVETAGAHGPALIIRGVSEPAIVPSAEAGEPSTMAFSIGPPQRGPSGEEPDQGRTRNPDQGGPTTGLPDRPADDRAWMATTERPVETHTVSGLVIRGWQLGTARLNDRLITAYYVIEDDGGTTDYMLTVSGDEDPVQLFDEYAFLGMYGSLLTWHLVGSPGCSTAGRGRLRDWFPSYERWSL